MKKTGLVLGGTGGIGAAVVRTLVRGGWNVSVLSRGSVRGVEFDNERVTLYTGNVTDEDDMRRVAQEFVGQQGSADCVIYAVGLPPDVTVALRDYPIALWDATFNTYVKGFLLSFQTLFPHMSTGGHIVVLGSAITRFSSDSLPPIYAGHYAAAKAALAELVKWTRREAKEKGVLVSLISPGAVDTAAHLTGELAVIPKKLLPVALVADTIENFIANGVEGELQIVV